MANYINENFALDFKGNSFLLIRKFQAFRHIQEGFSIGFWIKWKEPTLEEEKCIVKMENGESVLTTSAQSACILAYNYPEEVAERTGAFFTLSSPENLKINTGEGSVETGVQLAQEQWHFLMLTFSAKDANTYTVHIYVDGLVHQKPVDISFGPDALANEKSMGIACPFSSGGKQDRWRGRIAELQVWEEVLSAEKISQVMQAMPVVKAEPKLSFFLPLSLAENNGTFNDPFHNRVIDTSVGLRIFGF